MDDPPQQTLSIPSLVAFAVVSFFAIRYFFFSPPQTSTGSSNSSSSSTQARRRNFPSDRVDTVATMFPQLSRRDIEWDLVNNGGSAQATTERVLTGGRLGAAPHNFTALYAAPPSHATSPSSPNSSSSSSARQKPTHPDLITRYNLSARVAAAQASNTPAPTGDEEIQTKEKQREKGGWSGSKVDRQALLRQRREEMILAARRKMEERGVKGTKVKGKGRA